MLASQFRRSRFTCDHHVVWHRTRHRVLDRFGGKEAVGGDVQEAMPRCHVGEHGLAGRSAAQDRGLGCWPMVVFPFVRKLDRLLPELVTLFQFRFVRVCGRLSRERMICQDDEADDWPSEQG